jgi:hypothetical protein
MEQNPPTTPDSPSSRRAILGATGIATAAAIGLLASERAAAQQPPGPGGPAARLWVRFLVNDPINLPKDGPPVLCVMDYMSLARAARTEKELLLFFESHRSITTLKLKCSDPEALMDQVLIGSDLDLAKPAAGITQTTLSDYIEWETMLPPRPPT